MDIALRLIEHLLGTNVSIDRVDSIINELKISKGQLLQTINDDQYTDCFQLLRPSNNGNQGSEKIALTLDLFCCTHYANNCKNQSCPFLHLCPYNIRPMYTKCTNKTCSLDHDVLKSLHNRKIINARDLSFIPTRVLHEVIRASADPTRSFWVCNDYGKKNGCSKRLNCDKFHYCYYALTDTCTKLRCQHEINDACLAYFRQKELSEQEHEDILNAFRKVLRQRKPDYINAVNMPPHPSSASSSPKVSISGNNPPKSAPSLKRMTSETTAALYDNMLSSKSESPPPLADHEQDILLVDHHNKREYEQTEDYLSQEIGCPIRLLLSKEIISKNKNNQSSNASNSKPIYYYCPTKDPADIFPLLRWQNEEKQLANPLILYASLRDAHDAAKQNFDNNQFCLFRVHLFHSGVINGDLLPENRLQLNNSSTMRFDRMWIYVYNF